MMKMMVSIVSCATIHKLCFYGRIFRGKHYTNSSLCCCSLLMPNQADESFIIDQIKHFQRHVCCHHGPPHPGSTQQLSRGSKELIWLKGTQEQSCSFYVFRPKGPTLSHSWSRLPTIYFVAAIKKNRRHTRSFFDKQIRSDQIDNTHKHTHRVKHTLGPSLQSYVLGHRPLIYRWTLHQKGFPDWVWLALCENETCWTDSGTDWVVYNT